MNTNLFKQIAAAARQAVGDSHRAATALGTRLHTAAIAFIKGGRPVADRPPPPSRTSRSSRTATALSTCGATCPAWA